MSLLPQSTELGKLDIVQVYEYYDVPCLFSCTNEKGDLFLAIWSDTNIWLYTPTTLAKLN